MSQAGINKLINIFMCREKLGARVATGLQFRYHHKKKYRNIQNRNSV